MLAIRAGTGGECSYFMVAWLNLGTSREGRFANVGSMRMSELEELDGMSGDEDIAQYARRENFERLDDCDLKAKSMM